MSVEIRPIEDRRLASIGLAHAKTVVSANEKR